ncbi:phosphorylase family protein [Sorangium sp. So ce341]|uniref:5'-methylthioadenosine/S-adenosylhomocysteine nucleosidase family protein n=1 Tax=Sorangium sp. So ce341 TaxID=3133302 RepID=UPI003F62C172
MVFNIELLSIGADRYSDVERAAVALNATQREFQFNLPPPRLRDAGIPFIQREYVSQAVFGWLREYRKTAKGHRPYLIGVIDAPLRSAELRNLFGSHEAKDGVAVISLHDASHFAPNLTSYLRYYLVRFALSFVAPTLRTHKDTRACFFDRKLYKPDLSKSIASGAICDECRVKILKYFNEEIHQATIAMITEVKVAAMVTSVTRLGRPDDVERLFGELTGRASPPDAAAPGPPPPASAPAPPRQATAPTDAPVDFILITAIEEERDALLSKLPGVRKLDRDGTGAHTYYEASVATRRQDGAAYRVIVTALSGMGPTKGAIKAGAVVTRWNPAHVLMVGIAGGVADEVAPGDVIVASQVVDYTLGKQRDKGAHETRWVAYPADADLFDAARNFPVGWEDLVTRARPESGAPRRFIGDVASGGDVVASRRRIGMYRRAWPKLIGVEMEGGGVAAGLHDDIERPRFLMIRGVSDLADGENNAAVKAAWRAYACDVAAAYAIGLLRDGPVPAAR